MKVNITLKEKHLCHIGKYVIQMAVAEWGAVTKQITTAIMMEGITPETSATVSVEHTAIINLYRILGLKMEREVAVRNEAVKAELLPQLFTYAQMGTVEQVMGYSVPATIETLQHAAVKVLQELIKIDQSNYANIEASEEQFRQWAKQQ